MKGFLGCGYLDTWHVSNWNIALGRFGSLLKLGIQGYENTLGTFGFVVYADKTNVPLPPVSKKWKW